MSSLFDKIDYLRLAALAILSYLLFFMLAYKMNLNVLMEIFIPTFPFFCILCVVFGFNLKKHYDRK